MCYKRQGIPSGWSTVLAQFLQSRWRSWLVGVLAGGALVGLVVEFRDTWAALPVGEGQLGLYGSLGVALAGVCGYLLKATALNRQAAPHREATLKSARDTEKAKVERDQAVDRARALEGKVATLEVALNKTLLQVNTRTTADPGQTQEP